MKSRYVSFIQFIGFISILLIFVGCTPVPQDTVSCKKPYIRYAADCCLDQNNNAICDNDESAGGFDNDAAQVEEFNFKERCINNCEEIDNGRSVVSYNHYDEYVDQDYWECFCSAKNTPPIVTSYDIPSGKELSYTEVVARRQG